MKFYLISDNTDTQMGMRLAGVEGVVVHTPEQVESELLRAKEDPDVAIVLMTKTLIDMCGETVYGMKLRSSRPLIVEIPDRHATSDITDTISKYVAEAVGIKL